MKVCLDDHSLITSNVEMDAFVFLDWAKKLKVGGIHFSVLNSFKSLSEDYLKSVKEKADEYYLSIEIGMGTCNPYSDCRAARDRDRDPRESLRELIPVAKILGAPLIRTFFGFTKERFFKTPTLKEQIDATVEVLKDVKDMAEEYQIKIAMENHLALTSYELKELIDRVDSEYIGVCFDTGNPMVLLEDPVEVCKYLMPYICTTHVKDGVLCFDEKEGARWYCTVLGEGSCGIKEIVELIYKNHPEVNLNIEDLWDTFRVPIFDETFMAGLRHLSKDNIAQVVRWLQKGEKLLKERKIPTYEELNGDRRWDIVKERFPKSIEEAKKTLEEIKAK